MRATLPVFWTCTSEEVSGCRERGARRSIIKKVSAAHHRRCDASIEIDESFLVNAVDRAEERRPVGLLSEHSLVCCVCENATTEGQREMEATKRYKNKCILEWALTYWVRGEYLNECRATPSKDVLVVSHHLETSLLFYRLLHLVSHSPGNRGELATHSLYGGQRDARIVRRGFVSIHRGCIQLLRALSFRCCKNHSAARLHVVCHTNPARCC